MAVVLTVSICINVFQAIIFFLYSSGVKIKMKQINELTEKLEKELDNELTFWNKEDAEKEIDNE